LRLVLESIGNIKNRVIEGVALTPSVSANGNIYSEEEIFTSKNLNIPLRLDWEHTDEVIGNVVFSLNKKERRIEYKGIITSEKRASEIKEGTHKVSIEANIDEVKESCTKTRCYNLVEGITFEGLAVTSNPSVSTTSLKIIESFQDWPAKYGVCENCITSNITTDNPSLNSVLETKQVMIEDTTKIVDTNTENKEADMTCPEGKTYNKDTEKCESKAVETPCGCKTEKEVGVETTPQKGGWANADEISANMKELKEMISSAKEIINKTTDSELKRLDQATVQAKTEEQIQKEFNKRKYALTKVSASPRDGFLKEDFDYLAKEASAALSSSQGRYAFAVDMGPEYMDSIRKKVVTEAISFSGTQSQTIAASSDVFVLPGGKFIKSVRDKVIFDDIPDGTTTLNRYKIAIPNAGTITEGSNTTASTHTMTTVTLAANTTTGIFQDVKLQDVENTPAGLMQALAATARAEVLEAEATLVFDTAANAATPNLWINANSGATLTQDEVASMTAEPVAWRVALQDLETSGYDTSFGNAYCMLHPKALRELRGSTNLTTYIQQGDATITKTGVLSHLYGIELNACTAVKAQDNTTNDTYRNVVGIKNSTFWLASHRDLRIDMLLQPESTSIDWGWSQRKNATTFDPASFIRISSAQ